MPFVYVTNVQSRTVTVIDASTDAVVATTDVDGAPIRLAAMPDGRSVLVTMRAANVGRVATLDTSTHQVTATFGLGDFFIAGIAVTPDGERAYVANSGNDDAVKIIDTAPIALLGQVPMDTSIDVAVNPDGKHVYVTHFNGVEVIDTGTNTVAGTLSISKGTSVTEGRGIAVTPDGRVAYLTNGGLNTVSVIDATTHLETGAINVGAEPLWVAVSGDGRLAYVTNNDADSVSVIDTATNTVTATIAVGARPFGVAFSADSRRAYVANSGSNNVSVIDTDTHTVVATVGAGTKPFAVAVAG